MEQQFNSEVFIAKFKAEGDANREKFLNELCQSANSQELMEFMESLRRTRNALQTEQISFISDKSPEVTEAVTILEQAHKYLSDAQKVFSELETSLSVGKEIN